MTVATRPGYWRIRHIRFLLALIFSLTALGLSAFRISENVDASGSGNQAQSKSLPAQAAAEAKALGEQLGGGSLRVVKTELSIYRHGLLAGHQGQSVWLNRTVSGSGIYTTKSERESWFREGLDCGYASRAALARY